MKHVHGLMALTLVFFIIVCHGPHLHFLVALFLCPCYVLTRTTCTALYSRWIYIFLYVLSLHLYPFWSISLYPTETHIRYPFIALNTLTSPKRPWKAHSSKRFKRREYD